MEAYGRFAGVYDIFMDNVNYGEWTDYIIEALVQDGIKDGLVLELGCGTGTVTEMLADAGYDMIGIDNSEEMLAEAMEKRAESERYFVFTSGYAGFRIVRYGQGCGQCV